MDRLRLFNVGLPTGGEIATIVEGVFDKKTVELRNKWPCFSQLPGASQLLGGIMPRKIKKIMREALGQMLYQGRRVITADDVIRSGSEFSVEKQRIGFLL